MTRSQEDSGAPRELIERARQGEERAFGELYEAYVDRVYRYVLFRVRRESTAHDLTQDVFINVLRGLPRLQDLERFEGWLMRIAHNMVVNHWRRSKARPQTISGSGSSDDEHDDPLARLADASSEIDPWERADRSMKLQSIGRASEQLTDLQVEVLGLRFGSGLSLAETAGIVGRSEDAVKKLQRRALRALQRAFDGQASS